MVDREKGAIGRPLKSSVLLLIAQMSAYLVLTIVCAAGAEGQSPGVPPVTIWDPPAIDVFPDHAAASRSGKQTAAMIVAGERLFRARFNALDGAGRPAATGDSKPTSRSPMPGYAFIRTSGPDAGSCAACHNQPAMGGSGDFVANAFVGAHFADPPTLSIAPEFTNERNTISVFGAGAIEMLAREMSRDLRALHDDGLRTARQLHADQEVHLQTKGVDFGYIGICKDGTIDTSRLEGVDLDLVIRPFGSKGVAASIREFTIAALNQHHGIQAVERFGWERTGHRDFDEDGVEVEFTIGQLSALTLFQAVLPAPGRAPAKDTKQRASEARGERLFIETGCDSCHKPALRLGNIQFEEPNPFNRPGTATPRDLGNVIRVALPVRKGGGIQRARDGGLLVAAYSDLKRHRICDEKTPFLCNEKLRQDNVPTDMFMTAKLWDMATSGPYCHRGDCATVSEAILAHGAEASESRDRFLALPETDKRAVIAFLLSLGRGNYYDASATNR